MKIKSLIYFSIALLMFFNIQTSAQNNDPIVSNVLFSQRSDGSGMVDINYDVTNTDGGNIFITVKASNNDGTTWNYAIIQVSGDIGNVAPGNNKNIVWDFSTEHPNTYGDNFRIKIKATIFGPPCPGTPTVVWQGQTYYTVQIGDQCWLRENLNCGFGYSKCYDNDPDNCNTYGRLYDWLSIMNGATSSNSVPSGVQGICPYGWHIPSLAEWCIVTQYIDTTVDCESSYSGTDVGIKMKTVDGWSIGGTNSSGFSALPGGSWSAPIYFSGIGDGGKFWTSTEHGGYLYATAYSLVSGIPYILRGDYNKYTSYCSVRCIKD